MFFKQLPCATALWMGLIGVALAQVPMTESSDRAGSVVFVAGGVIRQSISGGEAKLLKGASLQQGDRIQTQGDGYVYVRMADGGLLVVRPASELRIDQWHFDPQQPQRSEIRYTLNNGVARYVSGLGSQAAKDKFRFNTPIAAIGVRGTDFTVLAESMLTRVVVRSGGVVVSRLGDGCRADALGPCEGESATELFASAREKMVQLRQGDLRPELVDVSGSPSPDKARPPANSEPTASRRSSPINEVTPIGDARAEQIVGSYVPPVQKVPEPAVQPPSGGGDPAPTPTPEPAVPSLQAVWGLRSALTGSSVAPVPIDELLARRSLIAVNSYFALAGNLQGNVTLPNAGSAEFKLTSHQGIVLDKLTNIAMDSTASNGSLRIDFVNRSFTTGFDLQARDISTRIEGYGSVGNDGALLSKPFLSQSLIQGVVGSTSSEAVYIYQRSLSKQFEAAGVASWGK